METAVKPTTTVVPVIDKKSSSDLGKDAAIEAEVRAARERALVPLDIRVKSFKEMLREKEVTYCTLDLFENKLTHIFRSRHSARGRRSCTRLCLIRDICC